LQEIPGGLPARYEKALAQRYKSIEAWQQFVQDSGLTKEQRRVFGSVVEARFQVILRKRFSLLICLKLLMLSVNFGMLIDGIKITVEHNTTISTCL